ncbi:MAG: hypothetical protein IJY39_10725 [Clostridia bacterium]|nr:hypothetical protein [Clostridia bacterium]
MSKWDDFRKSIGDFADKTVNKTRELTDTAALKIKIANKEADRDTEFRNLGRLAYAKLKSLDGTDPEELTAQISETLDKLDVICRELVELKKEDEDKKAAKEAEKAAKQAEKEAEEKDEELDMQVMADFNAARVEADAEYEKAKQAAEDAK